IGGLMSDTRRPGPGLVQIKHYIQSWDLTFEGYTEASAVGAYLWPNGVPDGVQITVSSVVEEPVQINELWKAKRETDLASDWLAWPNPSDMVPLPAATN